MKRAMAMIGSEKSSRNATTRVIQMNTGTLRSLMPFARRLKNVTMKLTDEINEAMPRICRPITAKSSAVLGEK
jgi:hypothetical protein